MVTQCSHLIDAACEVLSAPSLAEVFWEMVRKTKDEKVRLEIKLDKNNKCQLLVKFLIQKPNMGLGMILDSAVGMFPHKIGPLLQLLTALLSNKSTVKKVDITQSQIYTCSTLFNVNGLT